MAKWKTVTLKKICKKKKKEKTYYIYIITVYNDQDDEEDDDEYAYKYIFFVINRYVLYVCIHVYKNESFTYIYNLYRVLKLCIIMFIDIIKYILYYELYERMQWGGITIIIMVIIIINTHTTSLLGFSTESRERVYNAHPFLVCLCLRVKSR